MPSSGRTAGRCPSTSPSSSARGPTSSTAGVKYGSSSGHAASDSTGAVYGQAAGISSTGSRPTATIRSAPASTGASTVAPVSSPAAQADRSDTRPLALYVVSTGQLRRSSRRRSGSLRVTRTHAEREHGPRAAREQLDRRRDVATRAIGARLGNLRPRRVGREGDMHGAGGLLACDPDGRRAHVRGPLAADRCAPLRHGPHQRVLVEPLVRDAGALHERHCIRDQQHRLAIEQRLRDAVDGARDAGPARHDTGPRGARQLTVDTRHDRGRALAVHQHEPQPRSRTGPDQLEVVPATRDAVDDASSRGSQTAREHVGELGRPAAHPQRLTRDMSW